jgi:hypothetical protein
MADTPASPATDRDITCQAFQLALVATQLRSAWHAGVLGADAAMKILDVAVREVCTLGATEMQPSDARSAPSDNRSARPEVTPFDRKRR